MARPELEFFLLDVVRECRLELDMLDAPQLGMFVNRQVPQYDREELIDALSELFRGGDLIVRRGHRGRWFIPTREEIDAAVCAALRLTYGLTAQGGARWEAMAEYDWNLHIGVFYEDGFAGPNRETMEACLAWVRTEGPRINPGSERWSIVRPWKATYWKTIPQGLRVQYEKAGCRTTIPLDQVIGNLWFDEWHRDCRVEMKKFVPMDRQRMEPAADTRWRQRLAGVAQRSLANLPRLLEAKDRALQYAAALRLARHEVFRGRLVEWFLTRRTQYALLVIADMREPEVLDALVEAFRKEDWSDNHRDEAYGRDLGRAIARFGDAAVVQLAPFLTAGGVDIQAATLEALGHTHSKAAGLVILDWIRTDEPDPSRDYLTVPKALRASAELKELRALPLMADVLQREPRWAVKPLIHFNHPEAWKILETFIRSDADLRWRSSAAYRMARANPLYRDECERLQHSRSADVSRYAREFVRQAGVERLTDVLRTPEPHYRVAAITLLARQRGDFPVDEIVPLLKDPAPEVRANAVYAIGLRGGPARLVESLLNDDSGLVRYCARKARGLESLQ